MQTSPEIKTIWRTATEQCELVWSRFSGCHVRLWVQNRLILDELVDDVEAAVERALELRVEWPALVS